MAYINFLGYRIEEREFDALFPDTLGQVNVDDLIEKRRRQKATVNTHTVEWRCDDTTMILTNFKKLMREIGIMALKERFGCDPAISISPLYFDAVRPNENFYLSLFTSTPISSYECRVTMYTTGEIHIDLFGRPVNEVE